MPERLMGVTEIAQMLGVSRQRAHQLAESYDFPEPVARLAQGPVWETTAIEEWAKRTGRR